MFGAMQMYQMQAMEQHIAQKESRRKESVSRLVRLKEFLRRDLTSLGCQIDETFESVYAPSTFSSRKGLR
ncbi:hypothetical protein C0V97_01445 [Asaia sp. W19]|uniref:hypothetical protein n=1 Tax=unclassified Asaia TaxID=2685023 RepID=UPI000F8D68A7|nr:hypothetical protein [Asaia sp. W19]RUT27460.1 hypothetical protein C0V97_01445 [Asaia sp. W19]